MDPIEPSRFGGPDGTGDAVYLLQRVGPGLFRLELPFTYRDPHHPTPFVIPADVDTFTTDLGSIPRWFTWLVPFTGRHIPAMLVHDAMVLAPGETPTYGGDTVDRVEADRILRDAMAHLGTRRLRRWLVWAAVAAATAQSCRTPRCWWRWAPFAWGLVIAVIGVLMSVFLLTGEDLGLFGDDLAWTGRVAIGAAGALAVPPLLSWLFWRGQPESGWIGLIGGWSIAWLLWPTLLVLVAYGVYVSLEALLSRNERADPTPAPAPLPPHLDLDEARRAACAGRRPRP